jgi:hypothetical protein
VEAQAAKSSAQISACGLGNLARLATTSAILATPIGHTIFSTLRGEGFPEFGSGLREWGADDGDRARWVLDK